MLYIHNIYKCSKFVLVGLSYGALVAIVRIVTLILGWREHDEACAAFFKMGPQAKFLSIVTWGFDLKWDRIKYSSKDHIHAHNMEESWKMNRWVSNTTLRRPKEERGSKKAKWRNKQDKKGAHFTLYCSCHCISILTVLAYFQST
jgi:hypothetical protein